MGALGLTGSFPLGSLSSRAGAAGLILMTLTLASIIVLAVSAAFASRLIARLPEDYFVRSAEPHSAAGDHARPRRALLLASLRNAAGVTLVVAGTAMLVLPGQGVLTILAGLSLLDFPGKRKLQLRL